MAFMFENSKESCTGDLSLFTRPSVDTGVTALSYREYRPIGQITKGSPIAFNLIGSAGEYIDLKNISLRLKVKIVKADGTPVTVVDKVAFINNAGSSMFRQVDVKIQQKLVTSSVGTNYPYKAMLDALTGYTPMMENQLFIKDRAEHMDSTDPSNGLGNSGLTIRWQWTKDGQEIILDGPIFMDILQQDRMLIDGVPIDIELYPQTDAFVLMAKDDSEKYSVKITDAALTVPHNSISPGVLLGHSERLKAKNALYPFTRSDIKIFNLPSGSYTWTMDNLFQDSVPARVVVALVSGAAYSGNYHKNPFNFDGMKLTYLDFLVQGQSKPGPPYQPDYDKRQYTQVSNGLNSGKERNAYNYISYEGLDEGYAIYVFEVDRDKAFPMVRKGHTRMVLKLAEALPEAATLIVYGQFPAMMEIDAARNVSVETP